MVQHGPDPATLSGSNGLANTGGGGGGWSHQVQSNADGGAGGSGIVIIAYPT